MLLVPSEDSIAAIWVVFGHSAVISKNDKWSVYNGDLNRNPRLAYQSARPLFHCLISNEFAYLAILHL